MNSFKQQLEFIHPDLSSLESYIEQKINELKRKEEPQLYSEKDVILISYPDQFQATGMSPLRALDLFIKEDLKSIVNSVHILPFYPWTCDDGFGATDYQKVAKEYGTWEDIESFSSKLMFDCIFNHLSSENHLFKAALEGDQESEKMFHLLSKEEFNDPKVKEDIQGIVRPRTHPLFTPYQFQGETKYVWTTFSENQVDTNIANIDMMKYILESFFLYIEKGARFFRIDAIPFVWKELGTNSSHHPKTHAFVKLLRSISDAINPNLLLITESNVPHHENITYWGKGDDEAHVIYNFSLAPLILHALHFKTKNYLEAWANRVFDINSKNTYLNFTATHDGIGVRGLEGIVPEEDVFELCENVEQKRAVVGKKVSRDGTIRPYELNCTWASFFENENLSQELNDKLVINSHAVVLFFPGIPAHYAHNFFGTKNWFEGYEESGIARRLNRKKLNYPLTLTKREEFIKDSLLEWTNIRTSSKAFHPKGELKILKSQKELLVFERSYQEEKKVVIFNLTPNSYNWRGEPVGPYDLIVKGD